VPNFIAIDLDSQGMHVVAAGVARGSVKVTHAFAWNGEGEAMPALTADTAKAIGEKLREKLRAAGVSPAPAIVSIGRDRVILKELKYPQVPPTEEPALVRFQAMKEMSESPDDIVLDYAPLDETAGERRSMAVVMRKDLFGAIQVMCQGAGLKLAGISPRPYAVAAGLIRAFHSVTPPADKSDAVVALTLSPVGGEFTVVRRGAVTFTLAIPTPVVANEAMLVAQVRRNLAAYAGQHTGHPIQAVYLFEVGGPWVERLGSSLTVPVHAVDPLAGAVPGVANPIRGRFAGAVGLLAGQSTNALPINFASPRQPQVDRDPAKRRLAIIGILAAIVIVVGLGGGIVLANLASERVTELTQQRDDLKAQVERGAPDTARAKGIDSWTNREVNWLDELFELAKRMPEDDSVRVASLTATPLPVGKNGKQEAQANLELKLAARTTSAGAGLMSAFVRDNPTPNKYYVGTSISFGGVLPSSGAKHNLAVTVKTKVNHREPPEYTASPRFVPPKKTTGAAGGSVSLAAPTPALEQAPAPSEKTTAE